MAAGAAPKRLPLNYSQRGRNLRRRELYWRDTRKAASQRTCVIRGGNSRASQSLLFRLRLFKLSEYLLRRFAPALLVRLVKQPPTPIPPTIRERAANSPCDVVRNSMHLPVVPKQRNLASPHHDPGLLRYRTLRGPAQQRGSDSTRHCSGGL